MSDQHEACSKGSLIGRVSGIALIAALLAAGGVGCSNPKPEELIAAATRHLAAGDLRAAQIELRNALQQAPTSGPGHRLLGVTMLRLGDPVGAEVALRKALTLAEKPDEVVPSLVQALLRQGQAQKVIDEFAATTLQDAAANASLRANLGHAWLMQGDVKAATEAFAAALNSQPGHGLARLGQARIAAHERRLDEALALTDGALQSGPDLVEAHAFKGQLLLAKQQRQPAIEAFEKALAVDAAHLPARIALVSLLIDAGEYERAKTILAAAGTAKDVRVPYLRGLIALRQGELPKAKDALATVLKLAPDYGAGLVLAGEIDLRAGDLALAEMHLTKAQRIKASPLVQRLLATVYLKQNRPGKAIDTLQPLLQEPGAKDAALALLAGEAYLANGDARRAAEYFEASRAAGGNEATVRTRLGQVAATQGDFDRAIQELQAASSLGPQQVEPDLLLFSLHLRRNELTKALAAANAFVAKQPQSPLGHVLAGTAQTLQHDRTGARRSFEAAQKLKPDHVPALRGLAELDLAEGKAAQAEQRYEAVLAKKTDDERLLVALSVVQERSGRIDEAAQTLRKAVAAHPGSREPVVALVQYHLRRKNARAALEAAQEAVRINPDQLELVALLGTAQEAAGASKDALRTLNALVLKQPHTAEPLRRLAQIQARQGDFDGAVGTLMRAQEKAPHDDGVTRDLVTVYVKAGKIDPALKLAKEMQTKRPDFAGAHVLEGDVRAHTRKWAEAERAYRAALRLDPDAGAFAGKVYQVMHAAGRKKEAEDFAADWVARHPSDLVVRLLIADTALRSGNLAQAIKQYEAALAVEPDQPMVLNNLAWALGQTKDPKAVGVAERAAALAPNSPDVLDTLGVLQLQAGAAKKGLEVLERARRLAPDRPDLRLHYAKGLLQNGRTEEGKAELREVAKANPDFPGKAEIAALLATP